MNSVTWHAFYFHNSGHSEPPAWSEWIEAATEAEALNVARGHMGECLSAKLESPRWQGHPRVLVVNRDERAHGPTHH